ncbi:MAG: prenyltransferase/squalene oxidase repeat-containing protein [Planctomycetota bacterium]
MPLPRFAGRLHRLVATLFGLGLAAQASSWPAGVTAEIDVALERGREWLVRAQQQDGSWRSSGGYGSYPVAMTSLAGMALVAGGSTPTRGKHFAAVRGAVRYLKRHADAATGLIASAEDDRSMYAHGFATLFLASVFGMEEDGREQQALKVVLDRAVRLIEAAQAASGGWNYTPAGGYDEGSITITQVQALRACRMAGIVVGKGTIDRAIAYLRGCRNADGGICYRLGQPGPSRPAITAAGVAVLYNAGVYDDAEFAERAFQFCKRSIRVAVEGQHHFYTHQYWGQVLWQRGGPEWADYYQQLAQWLRTRQRPDGGWEGDGVGPVYGTAVALTLLQLPYAYVPIYQR